KKNRTRPMRVPAAVQVSSSVLRSGACASTTRSASTPWFAYDFVAWTSIDRCRRRFRSPPCAATIPATTSVTDGSRAAWGEAGSDEGVGFGAGDGLSGAADSPRRMGHRILPALPILVMKLGEVLARKAKPTRRSG